MNTSKRKPKTLTKHWFHSKSPAAKKAYLKANPNSKYNPKHKGTVASMEKERTNALRAHGKALAKHREHHAEVVKSHKNLEKHALAYENAHHHTSNATPAQRRTATANLKKAAGHAHKVFNKAKKSYTALQTHARVAGKKVHNTHARKMGQFARDVAYTHKDLLGKNHSITKEDKHVPLKMKHRI